MFATTTPLCHYESTFNVTALNESNGFIVTGIESATEARGLGDINGDGIDDFGVGIGNGNNNGNIYVIYGKSSPFNSTIALSSLGTADGFCINDDAIPNVGTHLGYVGDINNDGINDILGGTVNWNIGLPYSFANFGTKTTNFFYKNTSNLNGNSGFLISGASVAGAGMSTQPGDYNHDGIADILTGGPYGPTNGYYGAVYVKYGTSSSSSANFNPDTLNGNNGFTFYKNVNTSDNYFGVYTSGIGDINGDGIDDFATSDAFANNYAGFVYVVFGKTSFPSSLLTSQLNGSNGFTLNCPPSSTCIRLGGGGDINNDGLKDMVIGSRIGQAYVIFGKSSGYTSTFDLSTLNGQNGFTIDTGSHADLAVDFVGDVNGDNIDDLFVGASDLNSGEGAGYVLFGSSNGFPSIFNISNINGCNGIVIEPKSDGSSLGQSIGSADINHDGKIDLIIGAHDHVAVIYGGTAINRYVPTTTTIPPTPSSTTSTFTTMLTTTSTALSTTSTLPSMSSPTTMPISAQTNTTVSTATSATTTGTSTSTNTTAPATSTASSTSSATTPTSTMSTIATTTSVTQSFDTTTAQLATTAASAPLVTSASVISNFTSTTPVNVTLQSGGRTTTNASSWTSVIIGVTVGVVAVIGAGYLAYKKWRGYGRRYIDPQVKAAAGTAVINSIDPENDDPSRMQTNLVYEGVSQPLESQYEASLHEDSTQQQYEMLERQYEQPHLDTWTATYDTGHQGSRIAENSARLRSNTQWDPRNYETTNAVSRPFYDTVIHSEQPSQLQGVDCAIANEAPKIYLDDSTNYPTYERADDLPTQDSWGFGEEV